MSLAAARGVQLARIGRVAVTPPAATSGRPHTLKPPRLTVGPVSGAVYVVTVGRILGHDGAGRETIEAATKYDVSDQFAAIITQRVGEATDREFARRASAGA